MEINEILVEVQKKLKAPKGQTNKFGNYKYRSCEDIVEAVKPLLHEHGAYLAIKDNLVHLGDRYYVEAMACIEVNEKRICTKAYAREAEDKKGMDVAQITGAASSYARKYALNGLFAIDDTKDADSHDNREQVSPDPVDMEKVGRAVTFFKGVIDDDQIEADHVRVKDAWKRLTNDERLKVQGGLGEKAPDSNRMYKTILKDYLNYVPSEGVMK